MKRCPSCRRNYYDETLLYCLDDGTALLEGPATSETPTAIISGGDDPAQVTRSFVSPTADSEDGQSVSSAEHILTAVGRNKGIVVFAGVVLVAILTGIGFAIYKYRSANERTAGSMRLERVTTEGKTTAAAISPDGRYAVYNIDSGGTQSLWTRQLATGSPVQIVPPAEAVEYLSIRFSPDGNFVTFTKREPSNPTRTLYQMPVLGGPQKKLVTDVDGGINYSPDGKQVTFARGNFPEMGESCIMIANADGTNERILARRKRPETFPWWPYGTAVWSPDGSSIATVIGGDASGSGPMELAAIDVDDGSVKPLTQHNWYEIMQVMWLPDKSGLLVIGAATASDFYNQQIYLVSYPSGERRRITSDFNEYLSISLTQDGKSLLAVQRTRLSNIWTAPNGDASRAEQIKVGGTNYDGTDGLAIAPDGRIVFYSKAAGADDIWIMNADGSAVRQLTNDLGANYDLKVTPDGRYIVFTSERGGQPNIWRMGMDGGNPMQLTFGSREFGAAVTPDSKWVYFDSIASGTPGIWRVSIDGGEPTPIIKRYSENAEISPDGKFIACQFREAAAAPWRFAIFNIEGGDPLKVFDLPGGDSVDVRWAPEGGALHYDFISKGVSNVWSHSLDGGPDKQVTHFKTDRMFNFRWSSDGKNLVSVRGTEMADIVLIHDFR